MCGVMSEEEFTYALIAAVKRHPVLYNVELADYKNKNKKGEAFKNVQREIRQAGCSDLQVQSTYKKWISLKRKFRVEYFRIRNEEANGAVAQSNFCYFDALAFLVPYCDFYEKSICSVKNSTKKKRQLDDIDSSNAAGYNNDDSDDDPLQFDDDDVYTPTTLDQLLMSKAKKLKLEKIEHDSSYESSEADAAFKPILSSDYSSPVQLASSPATTVFAMMESNSASDHINIEEQNVNALVERLFSSPLTLLVKQRDPQQNMKQLSNDDKTEVVVKNSNGTATSNASGKGSTMYNMTRESQNALFGRLVASELDKLPENMHNIVRAQVLLLLAQTNSATSSFNTGAVSLLNTDKLLSSSIK